MHVAAGPSCPSSVVANGRRCVAILPWLFCAVYSATHLKGTDRSCDSSQFHKVLCRARAAAGEQARPKYAILRGGVGAVPRGEGSSSRKQLLQGARAVHRQLVG